VAGLQVGRLKASRDRLLAQIDEQGGEVDRLAAENASLVQVRLRLSMCGITLGIFVRMFFSILVGMFVFAPKMAPFSGIFVVAT
jgi:hypothetical protein